MASVNKNSKVGEWYRKAYPQDDLGDQIDDKVTFQQVIDCIEDDPGAFYSLIGVGDSVVRERIFTAVAGLIHKPYDAVYRRWLDNDEPSIKESVQLDEDRLFNQILMDYLCEGYSFTEALSLTEDTITPETIDKIEQTPAYRKLLKDIEYYFQACDDIRDYRDHDFKKDPIEALRGEAQFCKDTADFLGSVRLKGFPSDVTRDLMSATANDMDHLNRSNVRLTNIIDKQDNSVYLNPDGSVNVHTKQKPGVYAKRALDALRDFFARLGQEWSFDLNFYKNHEDMFADVNKILANRQNKGKNKKDPVPAAESWKRSIKDLIYCALNEGIYDKEVLLSMQDDLTLTDEQRDFFIRYIYYVID